MTPRSPPTLALKRAREDEDFKDRRVHPRISDGTAPADCVPDRSFQFLGHRGDDKGEVAKPEVTGGEVAGDGAAAQVSYAMGSGRERLAGGTALGLGRERLLEEGAVSATTGASWSCGCDCAAASRRRIRRGSLKQAFESSLAVRQDDEMVPAGGYKIVFLWGGEIRARIKGWIANNAVAAFL
ncbi:hypothetical protein B0H17DRAFT_1147577 [Mycena rosella]|uniref:Uncharacterized protein n=1 Tax=Mycena rosella TaxID=1033263 RepID=A0AAD7CLH5_MYCRO|nr:hypothetical protein B0H17DRAFT_1147577 [Mycena rosella]